MPSLAELKASSPTYAQMDDMEFASKVYRKHYADKMSFPEFAQRVGFDPYGDAKPADPTEGMSGVEKFAAGVGKSIYDTGRGLGQLVGVVDEKDVDAARSRDASLMHGAGLAGNILGTVGQVLAPGGAAMRYGAAVPKVAAAIRAASLPRSLGGMVAQGAALGATQQIGTGDSRLGNAAMGGAGALAGGLIPRGIGATGRAIAAPIRAVSGKGAERQAATVLRREAVDASRLMQSQPSAIPGVQRTLAEESLDPGIAVLQRGVFARTPEAATQAARNNSARVDALRTFAGDDAEVAAAEASRRAATEPLRQRAMRAAGVDVSRLATRLEGAVGRLKMRPAVQKPLAEIAGLLRASQDEPTVANLYNVRKTIDDMLSGRYGGEQASARAASSELMVVKRALDSAITKQAPEFGQYLSAYREASKGIDRMKVGQSLMENGAGSKVVDPVTQELTLTPAAFGRQAADLDRAAARATGFRKAKADNILQPQDKATIAAIADDLSRVNFASKAAAGPNSTTAQNLATQAAVKMAGKGLLSRVPLAGDIAALVGKYGEDRLNQVLATALQNPSEARRILNAFPANERHVVEGLLSRIGGQAGALTPALAE